MNILCILVAVVGCLHSTWKNAELRSVNEMTILTDSFIFTARCYAERGIAMTSCLSVRLSVRNVEVL